MVLVLKFALVTKKSMREVMTGCYARVIVYVPNYHCIR